MKILNASGVGRFSVAWNIWVLLAKYNPGSTTIGWTLWPLALPNTDKIIVQFKQEQYIMLMQIGFSYSFHPRSLVWSMKLRSLLTDEKTCDRSESTYKKTLLCKEKESYPWKSASRITLKTSQPIRFAWLIMPFSRFLRWQMHWCTRWKRKQMAWKR